MLFVIGKIFCRAVKNNEWLLRDYSIISMCDVKCVMKCDFLNNFSYLFL